MRALLLTLLLAVSYNCEPQSLTLLNELRQEQSGGSGTPTVYDYPFDDATSAEVDWTYTSDLGTGFSGNGYWNWDSNDTGSVGVGPTSGQGGNPDGYVYTEASSPGSAFEVFTMEWDTTVDASANSILIEFYTNQRGDSNNSTCVVQTNENNAGWVDRGSTFGGDSDPNKVASSGTDIWAYRSVDLDGLVSDANTKIRIKITFPSTGTIWHNDYGIDSVTITVTPSGGSGSEWGEQPGGSYPDEYTQLDTDITTYTSVPALSKPAYLASVTDPRFGTTITRISGDVGVAIPNVTPTENWKDIAKHGYNTRQPWNADESLFLLERNKTSGGTWGSSLFLDGETYVVIKKSNIPSNNESRWHPTDPDVRLLLRDTEVVAWSYANDTETQLYSFAGYTGTSMGNTGNWSDDGNMVAMFATRTSDSKQVVFAVNTDTDTKHPDIDATGWNIDYVTMSPLGTYIVVNADFGTGSDRTRIYNTTTGAQVGSTWTEYGRPSHFDVSINQNGEEVVIGNSKSSPDEGKLIARRMSDGAVVELSTGGYAGHGSSRAMQRRGWVVSQLSNSLSWPPYHEEIVAAKADGSRVERIVNHRSTEFTYDAETHACISPLGGRIAFGSDWGAGTYPIHTFVVDFRDKQ